jgi:hypothetical protein
MLFTCNPIKFGTLLKHHILFGRQITHKEIDRE